MDAATRDARNMIDDVLRSQVGTDAMVTLGPRGLNRLEAFCNALRDRIASELRNARGLDKG